MIQARSGMNLLSEVTEKRYGMLRDPQHERNFFIISNLSPFVLSLSKDSETGFSAAR
jgi:hypothetical protein